MIFVVVLTAADFFAPLILLGIIAGGYLLDEGIAQKAFMEWYAMWEFSPSWFLAVAGLLGCVLLLNVAIISAVCYALNLKKIWCFTDDLKEKLAPVVAVLVVVNCFLQMLFIVMSNFDIGNRFYQYRWLWTSL